MIIRQEVKVKAKNKVIKKMGKDTCDVLGPRTPDPDWERHLAMLEKQRKERVSMSEEKRASTEQAIGADQFARTIAHLHRRRGRINPKEHRERL